MILHLSILLPRCKIPHFTIVPIISQPHLWANHKNLMVVYDYPAVVDDIFVHNWPEFYVSSEYSNKRKEYIHSDVTENA